MGWVRVATFEEQPRPTVYYDKTQMRDGDGSSRPDAKDERAQNAPRSSEAPEPARKEAAAPQLQGGASDQLGRLDANESVPGTGWGERRNDRVERTEFTPCANFTDQLIFRYEYASGLRALGIFTRPNRVWQRENGQLGFVRPPM
jgi:hypothetical protein